jgi:hypothetical protein
LFCWDIRYPRRVAEFRGEVISMPYNLILTDPLNLIGDNAASGLYWDIKEQLKKWFNQVIESNPVLQKAFGLTHVWWLFGGPYRLQVEPHELLIYFTTPELSVASALAPRGYDPYVTHNWGYTAWGPPRGGSSEQVASEVYVYTKDYRLLSGLAFHEAMHNKLRVGATLHTNATIAGANGLAKEEITAGDTLMKENKAAMAAHLRDARTQYTDGMQFLLARRRRRDAGDPFWDK